MRPGACQEIETKVLKQDLCTLCGACSGNCPYIVSYEGRIVVRDVCDLPEGRCTAFCPRVSLDLDKLSLDSFGKPYDWDRPGPALHVGMARSADEALRRSAQDAGTVTSLIGLALEEGYIDSAVVTFFDGEKLPRARVVSDKEELLRSVRSNYTAVPVLGAFNEAIAGAGRERVGVVGTPCQALALAKMKMSGSGDARNVGKLKLVIGLFCTWALLYPGFSDFLKGKVPGPVLKFIIPPPPTKILRAVTAKGTTDMPLEMVMPFVRPACAFCLDMTSEFADISIGAAELDRQPDVPGTDALPAWNTIIVRTSKGYDLFQEAIRRGVIETAELPAKTLEHLNHAARAKKKRALREIVRKTGSRKDLLYLTSQPLMLGDLLEE